MPIYQTPLVSKDEALVDAHGRATPYFQKTLLSISRFADQGAASAPDVTTKVDKGTSAGWSAATGTASKAAFATYTAPTISNPPTQAEVQAIANAVQAISQHIKALIDALLTAQVIKS